MSSRAARLWAHAAGEWCLAAMLLVLAGWARRPALLPPAAAFPCGLVAGLLLFGALGGRRPVPPTAVPPARRRLVLAKASFIALGAGAEEVVWRWFLIGSLAAAVGMPSALVLSAAAFALAHAGGLQAKAVHLCIGLVLGALYAGTGSLIAAIAAHAAYNISVLLAVEGSRRSASARASPLAVAVEGDV